MNQRQISSQRGSSRAARTILAAGLTCGILDIGAAFIIWGAQGVTPFRLLQAIAGGLLGAKSFRGGWETAVLGGACHFLIAFSAAAIFYGFSRKLRFMTRKPFLSGVLYGIVVYLVMNWIVKPLSRVPRQPFSLSTHLTAVLTLIVCIGLPISLIVRLGAPLIPDSTSRQASKP